MKALVQITIWVWWTVMIVPALVCPSVIEETKAPIPYNTITFDFEDATTDSYRQFVKSLRNAVKSTEVFGLPVTAKNPTESKKYVLVQLKIDGQKFITLAIKASNMYVEGYLDKYQGKDRANFLSGAPNNTFPNATIRNVGFTGNYPDLEGVAKTGRGNIELGVYKLQQAIESVYGKLAADKIEAKFFIISIQMVSEAARFEYILDKVLEGGIYGSYKPDLKALDLETSWDKISKAIQTANRSTGVFTSPITLKDASGKTKTFTKVDEIKKDMGLLKFLE